MSDVPIFDTTGATTFDDLRCRISQLEDALRKCYRKHHICEDSYYSCPKSGDCPRDAFIGDPVCTCGADAMNAVIDAALSGG